MRIDPKPLVEAELLHSYTLEGTSAFGTLQRCFSVFLWVREGSQRWMFLLAGIAGYGQGPGALKSKE